jgi:hypothetical protein
VSVDAVSSVYDKRAELVEAARALSQAADDPATMAAAPAVTACLESALAELEYAVVTLTRVGFDATNYELDARLGTRRHRMHQGFSNLSEALHDAARAAAVARRLAARALHEA